MKAFIAFLFVFPFLSLSTTPCLKVFDSNYNSNLFKQEKYSLPALTQAINQMSYKDIISNYPRLSSIDEKILFSSYKDGFKGKRAFQILFLSNIYIVDQMVKKWAEKTDYEDLLQEGILILLISIEKYKHKTHVRHEKHVRFANYLKKALNTELNKYVESKTKTMPLKWSSEKYAIYKEIQERIERNSFHPYSTVWIQNFAKEHPQYSIKNIKAVLQYVTFSPEFLDYNSPSQNGIYTLAETLQDTNIDIEKEVINQSAIQKAYTLSKKRFSQLTDQAIIEKVIFSDSPKPLSQLGYKFSKTNAEMRHRYEKIIRYIKISLSEQKKEDKKVLYLDTKKNSKSVKTHFTEQESKNKVIYLYNKNKT